MTIHEIFGRSGVVPARIEGDAIATTMTMDSRRVRPGAMFVCMPSKNTDSNAFIGAAQAAGASSVLTFSPEGFAETRRLGMSAALVSEDLYQDSLWKLCKVAFGNPSASMKVIGVTGTNGKTTTAWLIRDMLKSLGLKAAYLGTLGFQLPGEERELNNTTPFAIELNELLAEARDKGVEAIAMEVSSHALAEKRVDGIEFDAAVFTNLTQDHLDFHGTMAEYEAAKLRLFTELPRQSNKKFIGIVNADDPVGREWAGRYELATFEQKDDGDWPGLHGTPQEIAVDHI
ncbi:MAG TPA: Mur ligase family protein, partial [Fimbriimonadaceae bacterium]|nr:Mur ligase family protein [Fimbriimonadaceae bacterium]